ncbi:MAG: AraC family transcriptional regulator, partial [Bacteroidota bacterium]
MGMEMNGKKDVIAPLENHTLLRIGGGKGILQVDFRDYAITEPELIFLAPDQYYSFEAGEFDVEVEEFPDLPVPRQRDLRYLFKHLVAVGKVNMTAFQHALRTPDVPSSDPLDISVHAWKLQNPFQLPDSHTDLLFDLKSLIDLHFHDPKIWNRFGEMLAARPGQLNGIVKKALARTLSRWVRERRMLEAARLLSFEDVSGKEIAFALGFRDPAYFHRAFRRHSGVTPRAFRESQAERREDPF